MSLGLEGSSDTVGMEGSWLLMRASLSAAPGSEYHAGRWGSELLRRRPGSSEMVCKLLSGGGSSNG
jgi:hypothetical protein